MSEPILDPTHPRLASFLERVKELNTAQWLIVCDRFVGDSARVAKAQQTAASLIAGADAPSSMRKQRLKAMDSLLHALAEALEDLPPHTNRNGKEFPLAGLAADASTAALQALVTKDSLQVRGAEGPMMYRDLLAPFRGFLEVGA